MKSGSISVEKYVYDVDDPALRLYIGRAEMK